MVFSAQNNFMMVSPAPPKSTVESAIKTASETAFAPETMWQIDGENVNYFDLAGRLFLPMVKSK
jgi:3-keto-L-gulonate-6-phosphate decarboxylase